MSRLYGVFCSCRLPGSGVTTCALLPRNSPRWATRSVFSQWEGADRAARKVRHDRLRFGATARSRAGRASAEANCFREAKSFEEIGSPQAGIRARRRARLAYNRPSSCPQPCRRICADLCPSEQKRSRPPKAPAGAEPQSQGGPTEAYLPLEERTQCSRCGLPFQELSVRRGVELRGLGRFLKHLCVEPDAMIAAGRKTIVAAGGIDASMQPLLRQLKSWARLGNARKRVSRNRRDDPGAANLHSLLAAYGAVHVRREGRFSV